MDEAHEPSGAHDRSTPPPSKPVRRSSLKSDQARGETADRPGELRTDRPASSYLTVTIDADSARVIRVDAVDATGSAHELSSDERAQLVKGWSDDKLQDVVEQAFEAGIACVLGGELSRPTAESPEDVELRHRLLGPLIERSAVGRLMERGALNRAVLKTLIANDTP